MLYTKYLEELTRLQDEVYPFEFLDFCTHDQALR